MMHCLCNMFLFFLMLIPHSNLVRGMYDRYAIKEDLIKFNITCENDSCEHPENRFLSSYKYCDCGIHCAQFGTCCYDSNYTGNSQPLFKPSCRSVEGGNFFYYMVDQCSSFQSSWANLCNTEWDGEDDPQRIFPVTSLSSSVTYKNYYCFRCHEATEDFLYWTANLKGNSIKIGKSPPTSLSYDNNYRSWMASYEDTGAFAVKLSIEFPYEIKDLVHICDPYAISDCSTEWSDEDVRNKCQSYTALRNVQRGYNISKYNNIHCALCNFENLNDISCSALSYKPITGAYGFSFAHLLDINRENGGLVGKRCSEDHLWDPFNRKCKKLVCAVPGYKIQNRKCVQG